MKIINDDVRFKLEREAVRLYAKGYNMTEIARFLGLHNNTLSIWKSRNKLFAKALKDCRKHYARGVVEKGLYKLAEGVTTTEEREEFYTEREIDGELVKCKVNRVVKNNAPDIKALHTIAKCYVPELSGNDDGNGSQVTIRITQRDRTLSVKDRMKVLDAECREIEGVDMDKLIEAPLEDFLE